jgi:hypothetical protein
VNLHGCMRRATWSVHFGSARTHLLPPAISHLQDQGLPSAESSTSLCLHFFHNVPSFIIHSLWPYAPLIRPKPYTFLTPPASELTTASFITLHINLLHSFYKRYPPRLRFHHRIVLPKPFYRTSSSPSVRPQLSLS